MIARDVYYNSGLFGGIQSRDGDVFGRWAALMNKETEFGGKIGELEKFPMPDQDLLNAVLQSYNGSVRAVSPPDVWFAAGNQHPFLHIGSKGAPLVLHQTGHMKPWRYRAPLARRPNLYEKVWYELVESEDNHSSLRFSGSSLLRHWFMDDSVGRASVISARAWRKARSLTGMQ